MKWFVCEGVDVYSDAGKWVMIILADSENEAKSKLYAHLAEIDNTSSENITVIEADRDKNNILFSNVEPT